MQAATAIAPSTALETAPDFSRSLDEVTPARGKNALKATATRIVFAIRKDLAEAGLAPEEFKLSAIGTAAEAYALKNGLDVLDFIDEIESVWHGCLSADAPYWTALQRLRASDWRVEGLDTSSPNVLTVATFLCYLAEETKERPLFLSCQMAGEIIGKDRMAGWRVLNILVGLGVLRRLSTGTLADRKASEFEYLGTGNETTQDTSEEGPQGEASTESVTQRPKPRDPKTHHPDPRARATQASSPAAAREEVRPEATATTPPAAQTAGPGGGGSAPHLGNPEPEQPALPEVHAEESGPLAEAVNALLSTPPKAGPIASIPRQEPIPETPQEPARVRVPAFTGSKHCLDWWLANFDQLGPDEHRDCLRAYETAKRSCSDWNRWQDTIVEAAEHEDFEALRQALRGGGAPAATGLGAAIKACSAKHRAAGTHGSAEHQKDLARDVARVLGATDFRGVARVQDVFKRCGAKPTLRAAGQLLQEGVPEGKRFAWLENRAKGFKGGAQRERAAV